MDMYIIYGRRSELENDIDTTPRGWEGGYLSLFLLSLLAEGRTKQIVEVQIYKVKNIPLCQAYTQLTKLCNKQVQLTVYADDAVRSCLSSGKESSRCATTITIKLGMLYFFPSSLLNHKSRCKCISVVWASEFLRRIDKRQNCACVVGLIKQSKSVKKRF